jgi:hypothetical protein
MDLSSISDEELQKTVREKLLGASETDCAKQKVVGMDEVENYLVQGWEYIAKLKQQSRNQNEFSKLLT